MYNRKRMFLSIEKDDLRCTLAFGNEGYIKLLAVLEKYYTLLDSTDKEIKIVELMNEFWDDENLGFNFSVHKGGFGIMSEAVFYINNEDGRDYLKTLKEALSGLDNI
ncbi:hypothetical protein [Francisella sp. TX07-6608]|uniref:hypothetical protein n=1 Tax=Francisella sp. TX07-6608 TaxID=573568 RepID=UPI0008F98F84|nr:hypothetical protein [Francisella sp. TX07-6608]OIN82900.1 hypothetical protein KX00_2098 [Francisella sp. TX07-6608]OIN85074.1 hypothetical protein KX00_2116 [Francisella sp. TX07-6608]